MKTQLFFITGETNVSTPLPRIKIHVYISEY